MQIPCKNLDKALLLSRNQVFCLKISKLWLAPTILQFDIFCWNFAHVFYLPMSAKGCAGFFLFYLDLELFAKIKKRPGLYTLVFYTFVNNSRSKQNKKIPHFCRHYQVENVCKISAKNIKLYGSWSSLKFSIFQTKNLVSWK